MTGEIAAAWEQRRPERHLLLACLFCVALGYVLVLGSRHAEGNRLSAADLLPLTLYGLSLAGLHLALVWSRFRGDQVLVAAVAFLAGFGLLAQTRMGAPPSAGGPSLAHYLLPAGMLLMLVLSTALMRGRYQALAAAVWVWAGVSIALVGLLLATGQRFRGGVYAAGFITPTETLKITVVLFVASYIHQRSGPLGDWGRHGLAPPWRELMPLAAVFLALITLLLVQRDLGMVVMLGVTLLAMLVLGTGRAAYLVYGSAAALGLGWLILGVFEHGQRRIQAWRSPFQDPTGDGWQILQGLSGMYSGGLWGEGFGEGNPEYTPIAESDFIYSVVGEELGFIGCMILVAFLLLAFARGLRIALRSRSSFGMLLCGGLTTVIATQTFLNIGGVTKVIPLTGITLPFISHGGSSLLTAFAAMGLMLAVSDGEASPRSRARPKARTRRRPGRGAAPTQAGKRPREAGPRKRR